MQYSTTATCKVVRIMDLKFSLVFLLCIGACKIQAEDCEDKLNENYWLNVFDADKKLVARYDDCADLVANSVGLCLDESIGGEGGMCCVSCPEDTCLDTLTTINTIQVGNKVFKNCAAMVTDEYRALCATFGGDGEQCCDSCSTQDLSCVDQVKTYFLNGKRFKNCKYYINRNPCLCRLEDVEADCCLSCSKADIAPCFCQDKLKKDNPLVLFRDKPYEIVIKNCKMLANMYPVLCDTYGGEDGLCCKSCDGVDTSCVDQVKVFFGEGGKVYKNCKSIVKASPCSCEDESFAEDCCHACSSIDLPAERCDCQNRLSKANPLIITNPDDSKTTINTCNLLATRYKVLCGQYGGTGKPCCRACENVDLSCVDEMKHFISGNRVYKSCKAYVKAKRCECYDSDMVKDSCCESCRNADITGCECRDKVNRNNPIKVTTKDSDGNVVKEVTITSCGRLVNKFPHLCATYGGQDNACCASCPQP